MTITMLVQTDDGLETEDGQQVACHWFALCDKQATHLESHPVLGPTPCCDRCAQIGR